MENGRPQVVERSCPLAKISTVNKAPTQPPSPGGVKWSNESNPREPRNLVVLVHIVFCKPKIHQVIVSTYSSVASIMSGIHEVDIAMKKLAV
jgi:hypothetical protein